MIELTEPQVWTLIGVFAAAMFSTMGLITGMFTRVLRAEIGGLRGEMRAEIGGLRGEMRAEFGAVRTEIDGLRETMNARFEAVDTKFDTTYRRLDGLDRDVQLLVRQVFNHPTE